MQLASSRNGDVDAEIIQTFDVGGVNFRREVVGRFVAEVAGIADGVGQSAVVGKFLIVDLCFAQKFDFFQFGVAASRLFGEIFVKAVAAEFYSEATPAAVSPAESGFFLSAGMKTAAVSSPLIFL